ncbi:VanZ family protein [Thermobrachium celere]|uniref:Acetobutylicum phosphotransbutyrylase n=1 Tax=Thermobrachium celere DSM 8682 TaxID=941824 RepID=R7RQY6_9CLOT|nr:VanZ family protein [Thermobrachium celere]CDF57708.1 acetobutylicum phosphotransbutyrylase [Thermobrachium celere DSM 8682]
MKRNILFLLLIAQMTFIFYMSSEPAYISHTRNRKVIETVKSVSGINLDKKLGENRSDHIVRKNAHFILFFLLGLIAYLYLDHTKLKNKLIFSLLLCFIYAVLDEIHQYFVPGRGPKFTDVLIDTTGAFLGIGLAQILNWKFKKIMIK